jgi:hypothetical protein
MKEFKSLLEQARGKASKYGDGDLTGLEKRILISQGELKYLPEGRERSRTNVFYLGTPNQLKACPTSYNAGATQSAKDLRIFNFHPDCVNELTVNRWLDGDDTAGCDVTTLALCGSAGGGKTTFLHMLGAEFAIGRPSTPHYCYFKGGADSGGLLSKTMELPSCAFVAYDDVEFKDKHGKFIAAEPMKSILDPVHGGSIDGMRYFSMDVPCAPRVLVFNGSIGDLGTWFSKHGYSSIGGVFAALFSEGRATPTSIARARQLASTLTGDDGAILRRMSIGYVADKMVTDEAVQTLRSNTSSVAADSNARRQTYKAGQAQQL